MIQQAIAVSNSRPLDSVLDLLASGLNSCNESIQSNVIAWVEELEVAVQELKSSSIAAQAGTGGTMPGKSSIIIASERSTMLQMCSKLWVSLERKLPNTLAELCVGWPTGCQNTFTTRLLCQAD